MKFYGIDVSHLQGPINWAKVQQGEVDFAMVRATYGKVGIDKNFEQNIQGIEKTQIKKGAYHYCYAKTPEEAILEAEHFLDIIKNYEFSYPLALYIEDSSLVNLEKNQISRVIFAFCKTIQKAGRYIIVYSTLNLINNYLDENIFKKYDLWLAQWQKQPQLKEKLAIWQYTNQGIVHGIETSVNLNISFLDYSKLLKYKGFI